MHRSNALRWNASVDAPTSSCLAKRHNAGALSDEEFPRWGDCESIKQHNPPQSHAVQNYQELERKTDRKTQKQGKKALFLSILDIFYPVFWVVLNM